MIKAAHDVLEFHQKMGIGYDGPPRELPDDLHDFRTDFLQEELDEYIEACRTSDLEGALDGLLDLIYVAIGTALYHGFDPETITEGWRRVQVANLAKRGAESLGETKRGHLQDVVKPEGWTSPRFDDLIAEALTRWEGAQLP